MKNKKEKKIYRLVPEFRPTNIQILLTKEDALISLPIIRVEYSTDYLRVFVLDYK